MGLQYRRSHSLGNGARLNVTQRGVGVSQRIGRATISSRGSFSYRIAPGWSFRTSGKQAGGQAVIFLFFMAAAWLMVVAVRAALLLLVLLWHAGCWGVHELRARKRARRAA